MAEESRLEELIQRVRGAHQRSEGFFEYGDAQAWEKELAQKRRDWGED